jgi:hypothetical protein
VEAASYMSCQRAKLQKVLENLDKLETVIHDWMRELRYGTKYTRRRRFRRMAVVPLDSCGRRGRSDQ